MKQWKRITTNIAIGVFFLLGGIEYAVILPTLYNYIFIHFHESNWLYGMIFSAFSFAQLFSNPLLGYLCDLSGKAKLIVIFGNVFEIGGNFLYFAAPNAYWLLVARLLCGVGAGAGSAIFAQISRNTAVQDRTKVFSLALMAKQSGMLLGPGLNVFLKNMNFRIGAFTVDAYTAPGIFMALIFLFHELMMIVMYYDMPPLSQLENSIDASSISTYGENNAKLNEKSPVMDISHNSTYGTNQLGNENSSAENDICVSTDSSTTTNAMTDKHEILSKQPNTGFLVDMLREEIIVILTSQFVVFFTQTAFETLTIPITEHLLGWGEIANSVMYCLCGVWAIFIFVFSAWLSKYYQDRSLMVIGIVAQTFALVWSIGFFGDANRHTPTNLMAFIVAGIFLVFGEAIFSVSSSSLFSKLMDEEIQGLAQGARRAITCIATIFGPLFAGGLVDRLYIIFGVMAGVVVFLAVLLFLSFNRLKEPSKQRRKKDRRTVLL